MEQNTDIRYIGQREVWGTNYPVGLRRADRRQHVYVLGKTGTGKSTLLRNMIIGDIQAGDGVGLIDPHGDLAEEILDHIPPSRTDDTVYFNPADLEWPIGFNLLASVPQDRRHLVASGVISAFKNIFGYSWGPRLEYIFYAAVAALLDCENVSLLGVPRMLSERPYRLWVVKQVKDPVVRAFWEREFEGYDKRFLTEAVAPIQNKVGQLLMSPPVRNIFGQVRSKFDPLFMMNNRRVFIANLSKGRLGEDKANLLGAMLVTRFQLAAMARSEVPEEQREDFFLHIDEFHNFSTDFFASILSEARKYRLCLSLSHQYVEQVRETVREAVFGNVGTIVAFRVGNRDALVLDREFGDGESPSRFTDLANHEVWVKLLDDGEQREPFRAKTLPSQGKRYGRRATIIARSRERYATARAVVEDKIERWVGR